MVTILHVTEDGDISRAKIAMSGKTWSRKFDAKRLFSNAPQGSKMVIKNFDTTVLEFPPGEKHSLWVPSSQIEWTRLAGITDWWLRVQVQASSSPD